METAEADRKKDPEGLPLLVPGLAAGMLELGPMRTEVVLKLVSLIEVDVMIVVRLLEPAIAVLEVDRDDDSDGAGPEGLREAMLDTAVIDDTLGVCVVKDST